MYIYRNNKPFELSWIETKIEIVDRWSTRIPPARPEQKISNDPCELDPWPIDLEMVRDTSSPMGCFCATYKYNPWNG